MQGIPKKRLLRRKEMLAGELVQWPLPSVLSTV
jgi:hypothetical protein